MFTDRLETDHGKKQGADQIETTYGIGHYQQRIPAKIHMENRKYICWQLKIRKSDDLFSKI